MPTAFLPQDKAPAILRRLIARRLAEERDGGQPADCERVVAA